MSCYTTLKIKVDNINLSKEYIQLLEDELPGHGWRELEDVNSVIEEDYLEYYIAFNNDFHKIIEILKIIEKSIIESDDLIELGEMYTEYSFIHDAAIYGYKNKIYLIGGNDSVRKNYSLYSYNVSNLDLIIECITVGENECCTEKIIEEYIKERTNIANHK